MRTALGALVWWTMGCWMLIGGAATAQDNTFYRKYNLGGMQGGLHLEQTSDGGFVATGQHQDNGSAGGCDVYVYRVDDCGNTLWFRIIGGGGADGGKTIRETLDGGYIISGHYMNNRGLLLKMDADGEVEWLRTFPDMDWTFWADATADGGYIVAGRNGGAPVYFKTDGDGEVLWSKKVTGVGEFPLYIEESDNGNFYFTSSYNASGRDIVVGALAPNGDLLWSKGYGTGWGDSDHTAWSCRGLLDDEADCIVITSPITAQGHGGEDILLAKVSKADGTLLWAKAIGGAGSDQSREIQRTEAGFVVIGNTNSSPFLAVQHPDALDSDMTERDILLVHVDNDGNEIFSRTYGSTGRDKGIGVQYNPDHTFTIAAYSNSTFFGATGGGNFDPLFIRTDTLGQVACQTGFPDLGFMDINLSVGNAGSLSNFPISAPPTDFAVNSYDPNDVYQCQICYTEPVFVPSATAVCVGEPVQFYNTTSVGLTCFQEWEVNGELFPGFEDTLSYVFDAPGVYTTELFSTCGGNEQTYTIEIEVYAVSVALSTVSNYNGASISCWDAGDGAAQAQGQGGVGPYTYQWSNGSFQAGSGPTLGPGTASVVVTDANGCTASGSVALSAPPALQLSAVEASDYNGYNIRCHGGSDGSLAWAVSGGTGGLQPGLNGAAAAFQVNNLPAGTHVLEVEDANGCVQSWEVELTEPPPLACAVEVVSNYHGYPISCPGADDGAASVGVTGGVGGYGVAWEDGVTTFLHPSLTAGTHFLDATDANGCPTSCSVTLTEPMPLDGTFAVVPDTCARGVGQCAFVPTGGVPAYTPQWSLNAGDGNGFARWGLPTGTYGLQVTDLNGCTAQFSVDVPEIPGVTGAILLTPGDPCTQEPVRFTFEGDRAIDVYQWDFGNGEYASDPEPVYSYFIPGVYQVGLAVEDVYSCPLEVSVTAFVSSALNLYVPNAFTPDNDGTNDVFRVEGVGVEAFHLWIWDRWGVLVFESTDPEEPWNGSVRGGTHYGQSDVYSYRVEASGPCAVDEVFMGTVTVVR